jgi:uncharacterized protein (TIGR03435 family)
MASQRSRDASRFGRKRLLTSLCMVAVAAAIILGLLNTAQARAQTTQPTATPLPSFEVASIKVNHSGTSFVRMGGPDVSRYVASNISAKMLITFAYNMRDFQVSGGPGWINSDKFDINAKVEDSLAEQMQKLPRAQQQDQMRLLLQSLLADRFKLAVSHETKELPIYALVVAKSGSKLKEVPPPDAQANSGRPPALPPPSGPNPPPVPPGMFRMMIGRGGVSTLTASASPISDLVMMLSQQLGRQLVDQTGLKGTYDFTLQWTSDMGLGGGVLPVAPDSAGANDAGGTSIFTALQDQLGLRLESTKGPVDTIVVDHIEEPSEN